MLALLLQKDNKTTLGEAEIQNAVEAAAVIFKKVVLQRREENKCKPSNANRKCVVMMILNNVFEIRLCVCGVECM